MNQLTFSFLMAALLLAAQKPQDPNTISPEMEQRLNLVANWGESLNSKGTKAEMVETGRTQRDGKLLVMYDIHVTGAPDKQPYSLMQWPITEPAPRTLLAEAFLDPDGRLCGTREKGCKPPVQIGLLPAKAEPFRILLLSKNGKTKIAVMVVPDPIVGEDKGCSLEAVRGTPKFEAAMLRGKGFRANEKLTYKSNSAGEVLEGSVKADDKGEVKFWLMPSVVGKDAGTDEVTMNGTDCAPKVSYKWGTTEQ